MISEVEFSLTYVVDVIGSEALQPSQKSDNYSVMPNVAVSMAPPFPAFQLWLWDRTACYITQRPSLS